MRLRARRAGSGGGGHRSPSERLLRWLPWLSFVALLAAWQMIGSNINPIFASTPLRVSQSFWKLLQSGELMSNFWVTARTFVIGLMTAMLVGAPVGILMGRNRVLAAMLDIHVRLLYSIPVIALFPLLILWIGLGENMRTTVVFLGAVLPVIINAQEGVRSVDPTLIDLARVYGATEWELFRKIITPATIPFLAGGFKIAIGRAIVTTVAMELLTSRAGLGGLMSVYGNQLKTSFYFAPLSLVALLSLAMFRIGDAVERRFSKWRPADLPR